MDANPDVSHPVSSLVILSLQTLSFVLYGLITGPPLDYIWSHVPSWHLHKKSASPWVLHTLPL